MDVQLSSTIGPLVASREKPGNKYKYFCGKYSRVYFNYIAWVVGPRLIRADLVLDAAEAGLGPYAHVVAGKLKHEYK